MEKTAHFSGKRKKCIARATVAEGKGSVRVNSVPLEVYQPPLAREKIRVPILLASEFMDTAKIDINANVTGGGVMGQSDAVASAIARALVEYSESDELLARYYQYERTLISRGSQAHRDA